jgi:hypothetical protein
MNMPQPGFDLSDRYDYYMIRLSQRDGEQDRMAGQIERMGTGEKRGFESGEQLLQLFSAWLTPRTNMESS